MTLRKGFIPFAALTLALSLTGSVTQAAQREERGNGRQNEGQARRRSDSGDNQRNAAPQERRGGNEARPNGNGRDNRQFNERSDNRNRNDNRDRNDGRFDGRRETWDRADWLRNNRGYAVPRPRYDYRDYRDYRDSRDYRRPSFNHRYGPNLSIFFGIGSGFRYGSPYRGRVYGYVPAPVYGRAVYYGDVRLQVRPRNAAVFVDGYYAGIVDDFDGIFQRLTLTVGPHEIEIEAPGFEPQVFNVLVDPARTVDVRSDLYPGYSGYQP